MFRRLIHVVERLVCCYRQHNWMITDTPIDPLPFEGAKNKIELLGLAVGGVALMRDPIWALPLVGGFHRERYCTRCGKFETSTIVGHHREA